MKNKGFSQIRKMRLRTPQSLMDEKRKGGVLPTPPEYMPFIGQMKAILTD